MSDSGGDTGLRFEFDDEECSNGYGNHSQTELCEVKNRDVVCEECQVGGRQVEETAYHSICCDCDADDSAEITSAEIVG